MQNNRLSNIIHEVKEILKDIKANGNCKMHHLA
jgi:hypothetical protein